MSGRAVYAYVGGNPITFLDPLGLYNWGQIVAGSVQTAAGLVQSTAGTVEVLAGIVGTPETGGVSLVAIAPGLANVGVGGLAIKDGTSLITQGITGEDQGTVLGNLGNYFGGAAGQIIGNIINAAIGVKAVALGEGVLGATGETASIVNAAILVGTTAGPMVDSAGASPLSTPLSSPANSATPSSCPR